MTNEIIKITKKQYDEAVKQIRYLSKVLKVNSILTEKDSPIMIKINEKMEELKKIEKEYKKE